ncbi:YwqG family protein [Ostreibacterium oceani]|uniref:DUF1963 domain-containing protein n=1 Tax=Ostreibacterium oceani TaxID=2654998 RepID=A0A6N7EWB6_9GAMM|nr:YwqG family protein [Ostreibacterium oceani]MPV86802.1 DUF1963 domain-containing protein [Ostreibacterium oceani]
MFIPIEFQKAFEQSQQSAIRIHAKYQPNDTNPLASKFGGTPFWPDNSPEKSPENSAEGTPQKTPDKPVDSTGRPLYLLAQINFAEINLPSALPKDGLLQIFIPMYDPYYGANFDEDEDGGDNKNSADDINNHARNDAQAVRYYYWEASQLPTLDTTNPSTIKGEGEIDNEALVPVFGAHYLTFESAIDYPNIDTIELAAAMQTNPFNVLEDVTVSDKEAEQFYDAIQRTATAEGHKLLGAPYFTQTDPRTDTSYQLLLQIDTDMDGDNDIMWGDNGVGHFFIRPDDLRNKNFASLWFHWDCH